MSETYLDDLFDRLVTVEPRPAWNDVLARNRRSRRRLGALAAAVALLVLAPAAWAIDGSFFGSPPPPDITSEAAAMNRLVPQAVADAKAAGWPNPEQYGTTADLSELGGLIQVQTPDGPLDVFAAPSSNGGLCYFMAFEADIAPGSRSGAGPGGGCTQPGGLAKNYSIEIDSGHPDVYLDYGYTDNAHATSAQVTMKVGENVLSKTAPVVDGFYLVVFPRDPSATDAWDDANIGLETVVTYDASGNEVETWKNPWQIPCPKPAGQGACTPATP
jgi:hypothetical protein